MEEEKIVRRGGHPSQNPYMVNIFYKSTFRGQVFRIASCCKNRTPELKLATKDSNFNLLPAIFKKVYGGLST
jgi:hypothetical protein